MTLRPVLTILPVLGTVAAALLGTTALASGSVAAQVPQGNSAPQPVPIVDTIPAAVDQPYPGTITLDIDATNTQQNIFTVRETIPVAKTGDAGLAPRRPATSVDRPLVPRRRPSPPWHVGPTAWPSGEVVRADGRTARFPAAAHRLDWGVPSQQDRGHHVQ